MLCGIIILALPITVIGTNFARVLRQMQHDKMLQELDNLDRNDDGVIDSSELQVRAVQSHGSGREGLLTSSAGARQPVHRVAGVVEGSASAGPDRRARSRHSHWRRGAAAEVRRGRQWRARGRRNGGSGGAAGGWLLRFVADVASDGVYRRLC